ncbi:MAG: pilus assembly protein TadG-related protein [Pirellulaceae bacterium]|nr:pilus assembly protein TadG-related protein [Pirellulaceae bacterium]
MKARPSLRRHRRGNIIVLTAFLLVVMVACIAFAVDVGYLYTVRSELQRSADSAAIAAAWELMDEDAPAGSASASNLEADAVARAGQYAALNPIGSDAPTLASGDVVVGYMANPSSPAATLVPASGSTMPNAVQVTVQRTTGQNGQVPLFFARILGMENQSLTAHATAALLNSFGGFHAPHDGSNLGILPFALDEQTWNDLLAGGGTDSYKYNSESKTVSAGVDGVKEVNLYPQGTGSPGNRGTVDIGGSNNSTADLARQITDGISADDLEDLGKPFELGSDGTMTLNGDTGISAGVKDELASIIGQTRIIPIFRSVTGPGNNAQYTIVKFAGIRVLAVKLTGSMSSKMLMIQPATVVAKGGIPATGTQSSYFLYSPVWLVR